MKNNKIVYVSNFKDTSQAQVRLKLGDIVSLRSIKEQDFLGEVIYLGSEYGFAVHIEGLNIKLTQVFKEFSEIIVLGNIKDEEF